jgi:hypothetical protein
VPIILTSRANSVRPARPREVLWISTLQSKVSTWAIFGQRETQLMIARHTGSLLGLI